MTVYGDDGTGNQDFDILDLGVLGLEDFSSISKLGSQGNNNCLEFVYDGHSFFTQEFDQFILDGVSYSYNNLPTF